MHIENTEYNVRVCCWPIANFSGPSSSGTVTLLIRCLRTNRLGIGSGLKGTITNINISASAVNFLGPHAAIYQPKGMDMTGNVSENGETDVDQEVTSAAGNEKRRSRRKDDSDDNEANV